MTQNYEHSLKMTLCLLSNLMSARHQKWRHF